MEQSDGSIVINTEIDSSELQNQLEEMKALLTSFGEEAYQSLAGKMALSKGVLSDFSKSAGELFKIAPSNPNVSTAYLSLFSETSHIYTSPPSAFAAQPAKTPIVPAPTTSTLSPFLMPALCTP